eukprot:5833217-Prymnesium_polylepis.1
MISSTHNRDLADITRSLIKFGPRFGRDRLRVDTPEHTSAHFRCQSNIPSVRVSSGKTARRMRRGHVTPIWASEALRSAAKVDLADR